MIGVVRGAEPEGPPQVSLNPILYLENSARHSSHNMTKQYNSVYRVTRVYGFYLAVLPLLRSPAAALCVLLSLKSWSSSDPR